MFFSKNNYIACTNDKFMNSKHMHPAYPPQILLDQFQRPVAPIPGMSMLDHFALQIWLHRPAHNFQQAIETAREFLTALSEYTSNDQLSTLKIIDNE